MLALALVAGDAAQAQEVAAGARARGVTLLATVQPIDLTSIDPNRPGDYGSRYLQDPTEQPAAPPFTDITVGPAGDSVSVVLNFPDPEPWDGFRHSVSDAAASSCFGPDALPHEEFAVQGLLRLPFLVQAAAASTCR
jgi:hypothetical protein